MESVDWSDGARAFRIGGFQLLLTAIVYDSSPINGHVGMRCHAE
jgi:hypothetical protein